METGETLSKIIIRVVDSNTGCSCTFILLPGNSLVVVSKLLLSYLFLLANFNYGLTAYFIKTAIIYSVSLLMIVLHRNVAVNPAPACVGTANTPEPHCITSMLVADSNNTKVLITTSDILYFSANAPYINIYHQSRKYLHTGTLKSLETRLDNNQFIRIHKSCIVNLGKVISYQSRLNGDYDLTLTDNTVLRVSRIYATIFKLRFEQRHRLTVK